MTKVFQDQVTEYGGSLKFGGGISLWFVPKGSKADDSTSQAGLIVQQINIQANRPLQQIYDLTTKYAYSVASRVQTTVQLDKMVGPAGIVSAFYEKFGDVCQGINNDVWMQLAGVECTEATAKFKDTNDLDPKVSTRTFQKFAKVVSAMLQQVTFSANVQSYLVTESCQIQGLDLEFTAT
jgi:hypothetical protein